MKSKLALIQGPPGTGKTVVGLKIAELLLNNIHIWRNENEEKDGPFLLIRSILTYGNTLERKPDSQQV
jgi:Holliday junction resolvasome RuvABC ATP-dependent DNA helicase subunit